MSAPAPQFSSISTPILDRLAPFPPKVSWQQYISELFLGLLQGSVTACLVSVFILGFIAALPGGPPVALDSMLIWLRHNLQLIYMHEWARTWAIFTILLILLTIALTVLIHELGHVGAGLVAGFRLKHVRVGKIEIDYSLRFSRSNPSSSSGLGSTLFFPQEMRHHPWKYMAMVACGPLANLFSALLVFWLPYQKSLVSGSFIAASLYFGLVNLFPFRTNKIMSDGLQLLRVLFKRSSHERALAFRQLLEEWGSAFEPEKLAPALLADLTVVRDNSLMTVMAYTIAHAYACKQKDYVAAGYYLETCLLFSKKCPQLHNTFIANAAILQAQRKKIHLAQEWLAQLPDQPKLKSYRLRAEGAIAEAQGDFVNAIHKVEACLKEAETLQDESARKRLVSKLVEWKDELEQNLAKPCSS
ncbi:MAG TPA: hypothetical protein VFR24_11765 [Candidatus Angelobacter sp.]|nr:hypothetical protein [Candidatus Angelobacter sp.]